MIVVVYEDFHSCTTLSYRKKMTFFLVFRLLFHHLKTILDDVTFSKFQEFDFHVEPNLICKLVMVFQLIVEYQVPLTTTLHVYGQARDILGTSLTLQTALPSLMRDHSSTHTVALSRRDRDGHAHIDPEGKRVPQSFGASKV